MKNRVVEPNVVNKVSNVNVSVENEMPSVVFSLSFLQEEMQILNKMQTDKKI